MTLQALYEAIDWSEVDLGHEKYLEESGSAIAPREEFLVQYRMVLLMSAIYGSVMEYEPDSGEWEMVEVDADTARSRAREARRLLGPIWSQVVIEMRKDGFPLESERNIIGI